MPHHPVICTTPVCQAIGNHTAQSSQIHQRSLQNNNQHLPDTGSWLAIPPTTAEGHQTRNGVLHYTQASGHPCFCPLPSSTREHSLRYFQQYRRGLSVVLYSFFPSEFRLRNQLPNYQSPLLSMLCQKPLRTSRGI